MTHVYEHEKLLDSLESETRPMALALTTMLSSEEKSQLDGYVEKIVECLKTKDYDGLKALAEKVIAPEHQSIFMPQINMIISIMKGKQKIT